MTKEEKKKKGRGQVLKRLGGCCDALAYAIFCGDLADFLTDEESNKLYELHSKLAEFVVKIRGEEFAYQNEEPTEQN